MGECKLDHSLEDVKNKLEQQRPFLNEEQTIKLSQLLERHPDQVTLNEIFHLLKKYDLADEAEREHRNQKLDQILITQHHDQ